MIKNNDECTEDARFCFGQALELGTELSSPPSPLVSEIQQWLRQIEDFSKNSTLLSSSPPPLASLSSSSSSSSPMNPVNLSHPSILFPQSPSPSPLMSSLSSSSPSPSPYRHPSYVDSQERGSYSSTKTQFSPDSVSSPLV